eukprot:TRINITY_DN3725_c0_g1_i10.p1 TRINITY_DN3725_c0_g1~~TRINITY_DN3725_c0_g1_i10.p1  ORF type:complete len:275 (+),score=57.22 TRINITY_DN3725_c0_g1_i10:402-1226(+)
MNMMVTTLTTTKISTENRREVLSRDRTLRLVGHAGNIVGHIPLHSIRTLDVWRKWCPLDFFCLGRTELSLFPSVFASLVKCAPVLLSTNAFRSISLGGSISPSLKLEKIQLQGKDVECVGLVDSAIFPQSHIARMIRITTQTQHLFIASLVDPSLLPMEEECVVRLRIGCVEENPTISIVESLSEFVELEGRVEWEHCSLIVFVDWHFSSSTSIPHESHGSEEQTKPFLAHYDSASALLSSIQDSVMENDLCKENVVSQHSLQKIVLHHGVLYR